MLEHKWFKDMDFEALKAKKVDAYFKSDGVLEDYFNVQSDLRRSTIYSTKKAWIESHNEMFFDKFEH